MHFHIWKIIAQVNFATFILLFATFDSVLSSNSSSIHDVRIDSQIQKFIVGGVKARDNEFPFQVALCLAKSDHIELRCGGTIISPFYVLTAGHCINGYENNPEKLEIIAGAINLKSYNERDVFQVVSCVLHPNYQDKLPPVNDIGVCKVNRSFADHPDLAPASLPRSRPHQSQYCTAIGWGLTSVDRKVISPDLMKVNLPMYDTRDCAIKYWSRNVRIDSVGSICVGYRYPGKSICNGDSGGPLICNNVLTGVASWGHAECGKGTYPSVFTNVYKFIEFIRKCLKQ